jgi:hypothetical protein
MEHRQNNASLIRTLCGLPDPRRASLLRLGIISAILAFPAAFLMQSVAAIVAPPRTIAIILSPGYLVTTLATPNPQVIADFLRPSSPDSSLAFLANLLYWFLILFGLACCIAGLRKLDSSH